LEVEATMIVEDAGDLIVEITALLRERAKKYGACQVSSKVISNIVMERTGFSGSKSKSIATFIEGFLQGSGLIEPYSHHDNTPVKFTVYDLVPEKLLSS
jgi:hypothetical protein